MAQDKGRRVGENFCVRLSPDERAELESMCAATVGPAALGPWLVWAARRAFVASGVLPLREVARDLPYGDDFGDEEFLPPPRPRIALPTRVGIAPATSSGIANDRRRGIAGASRPGSADDAGAGIAPIGERVILDLCAGSGSWSEPYKWAGYDVRRVTLPDLDVRLFTPPDRVWGVLAAPPCTEFSLARNASQKTREFADALEVVSACLRVVVVARPQWWALENPIGLLSHWLGAPADSWEPYEFGDPWTKPTAIWGDFARPERGPFVKAIGSAVDRATPAERAITPPGFARAFFEANP